MNDLFSEKSQEFFKKIYYNQYTFLIDENVYEPAEDTSLLANNLNVSEDDSVLDIGTGCGILSILASEKAKKVVGIDINPYSISCAKKNLEINKIGGNIDFRLGDMFKVLKKGEQFSLILFNSPYLPSDPDEEESWIGKSWAGGPTGRKVIDRFLMETPYSFNS